MRIRDEQNADAPVGDVGEIQLRGPNVIAEYWNKPEASRDSFVDGNWFKTGDMGYVDADGFLYVIGRKKEILVLQNGYKVNPVIVEQAIRTEMAIDDCAVFGDGRPYLVAVIVPADPAAPESLLHAALDRVNAAAPANRAVYGFVRSAPFAMSGLATSSGKLSRGAIAKRFAAQLESLYTHE
jgi:long-subunit acyl-CoA synthetase (AMP-forming)